MKNFSTTALSPHFGLSIKGVHLPVDLNENLITAFSKLLMEHKVLLLRDQQITPSEYADFGRQWTGKTRVDSFTEMHVPGYQDMNMVGNVGELFRDPGYRNGAAFWHTDCAAEPDPNAITMLYCIHALAKDGETVFANMQAAYEALDKKTKSEIENLTAHHCYAGAKPILGGREEWEFPLTPVTGETAENFPDPVVRPLVRAHSVTGAKSLYAPAGSAFAIEGMPHEDANALMHKLKLHAIQREFCYSHQYRPGDLIIWDNTSTLHYATPTNAATGEHDRRLMHRISPLGLPKFFQ